MEVAHAPIATAKAVGGDGVEKILLWGAVREVAREVIVAAQCHRRRHHAWRQGGRVGKGVLVDASSTGEGHGSPSRAAIAGSPAELSGEGAVGAGVEGEHVPDFGRGVGALSPAQ